MTRRTRTEYDWARLEFDETILTKHFTRQRVKNLRFVVVHHMAMVGRGDGKALDACYRTWQTRQASAHYGVDGPNVRQFVFDKDYAWATGSYVGNRDGISIEHANSIGSPRWKVSDETWRTGARLAAYLHHVYRLGRPVKDVTLRRHSSFTSTACPGPYLGGSLDGIWGDYVAEAQRIYDQLAGVPTAPKPEPSTGSWYVVTAGDTLTAIARRYGVTVASLVAWNRIKNANLIKPGQKLRVGEGDNHE